MKSKKQKRLEAADRMERAALVVRRIYQGKTEPKYVQRDLDEAARLRSIP